MLTRIKASIEHVLSVPASALLKLHLTPNVVSVAGVIFSFIAAYVFAIAWGNTILLGIAALMLLISGFFDALDGAMARLMNSVTHFGSFLDSVLDRYADAVVIMGITLSFPSGYELLGISMMGWGFIAILGSILVSYSRAKAESLGVSLASIGLAERPERIVILIFFAVIARPDLGVMLIAVLANITVLQRGFHVYRKLTQR